MDSHGVHWTVWNVYPTVAAPRQGDSQRAGTPARVTPISTVPTPDEEPSSGVGTPGARTYVAPGLEQGWLAFESAAEKRRLWPIPDGWAELSDEALGALCARAVPATRRPLAGGADGEQGG